LATESGRYLSYLDALFIHFELMQLMGDARRGVFDRSLLESALARPRQAAAYENADLIRQAATLCYGLIKNHPWLGGNKRTATAIVNEFLKRNGFVLAASIADTVDLALAVEADQWDVDEIENWLRRHTTQAGT
jgi:death-on-curing protein